MELCTTSSIYDVLVACMHEFISPPGPLYDCFVYWGGGGACVILLRNS